MKTQQVCQTCGQVLFPDDIFCPNCAVVESHRTAFSRTRTRLTWHQWDVIFTGIVVVVAVALIGAYAWMTWR